MSCFCFVLLHLKSYLYILNNNLLPNVAFANIFCLWLIISLSMHCILQSRVCNFTKVQIIHYFFIDHAFGIVCKKTLLYLRSSTFSLMLSCRTFIVSCFTFSSVIHLELIFVNHVQSMSRLLFFACGYPVIAAPFVEKTICSIVSYLLFYQRWDEYIYVGLFLSSIVCSIVLFVYFFTNTTLFWLQ